MATLLTYLEWKLQHKLGFKFTLVSFCLANSYNSVVIIIMQTDPCELNDDGTHMLQLFEKHDPSLSKTLEELKDSDITPNMIEDAFIVFKDEKRKLTKQNELVLSIFKQWLMTHLCKRLMQLMTPEALITYHNKLPNHYISHYLNFQSHFSLRVLITRFHEKVKLELQSRYTIMHGIICNELLFCII